MRDQMELLERPAIVRAKARADIGIQRSVDKNETLNPGWCEAACEALRRAVAHNSGGVFIIEHLRAVIEKELPAPSDKRCWGQVTRMAVSRGYIERVKGQYFPAASSNASPKAVYRRGKKAVV